MIIKARAILATSVLMVCITLGQHRDVSVAGPVEIYQTDAYQIEASWILGQAPNRTSVGVVAWQGTETTGTGKRTPVAGAGVGLALEQADGSFLPVQACYPSGTDGTTTGFAFPPGSFIVNSNLRSAHVALVFDCFMPTYPYNVPTGVSLNVALDWRGGGPIRVQPHGSTGGPGHFIIRYSSDATAVGFVTDGVLQYAPGPSSFALLLHDVAHEVQGR